MPIGFTPLPLAAESGAGVGIAGIAWSQRSEPHFGRKAFTDPPAFGGPPVVAVGISGVAWSERFEPHLGKPIRFTTPPSFAPIRQAAVGISGVAFSQPLDYATPKKGRTEPPAHTHRFVPAVGVQGVAFSQPRDWALSVKGWTIPPAHTLRFIPAVGVSGVAWAQRLDYATPRKGQTNPPAHTLQFIFQVQIPVAGMAWMERFEPFYGRPIRFTTPSSFAPIRQAAVGVSGVAFTQPMDYATPRKGRTEPPAHDPQRVAAVGVQGIAWSQRLDMAFPVKGRTQPPAHAPRPVVAVGIQGVAWSQRSEPFYGRPMNMTVPYAFGQPHTVAEGQTMAWFIEPEFWRPLRPFAFTSPPGDNPEPFWVVRVPTPASRRPLLRAGGTKGIYWKGRSG